METTKNIDNCAVVSHPVSTFASSTFVPTTADRDASAGPATIGIPVVTVCRNGNARAMTIVMTRAQIVLADDAKDASEIRNVASPSHAPSTVANRSMIVMVTMKGGASAHRKTPIGATIMIVAIDVVAIQIVPGA